MLQTGYSLILVRDLPALRLWGCAKSRGFNMCLYQIILVQSLYGSQQMEREQQNTYNTGLGVIVFKIFLPR